MYDTCEVSTFLTPATMAGSWFYFERDLGNDVRALMRKSILDGAEETIFEYASANGETGAPRLTFVVDETCLTAIYYRDGNDGAGTDLSDQWNLDMGRKIVGIFLSAGTEFKSEGVYEMISRNPE